MSSEIIVRDVEERDRADLRRLHAEAFPEEDLWPLVLELLAPEIAAFSLVAQSGAALVGHVAFSRCAACGGDASLLGPLAVAADARRAGVGAALVREGIARARREGALQINVLGDPAYYGRLGFARDDRVEPPYPLPHDWADAWASLILDEQAAPLSGALVPPAPWMKQALWSP